MLSVSLVSVLSSLKTVHTNIFANNRKLHKIATTNSNIEKNDYFRNASSYNVRVYQFSANSGYYRLVKLCSQI